MLKDASTIEKMAISGDAEEEIDSYNATLDADKSMPAELLTLDALSLESNILPSSKKIKTTAVSKEMVDKLVKEKSRNVVVTHTLQEYERYASKLVWANIAQLQLTTFCRYWEQFIKFCTTVGFINTPEDIEKMSPDFSADIPKWITFWIMEKYVVLLTEVKTSD